MHYNVEYFLKASRFAPCQVEQAVRLHIQLNAACYVIFVDSVVNKERSHTIQLVGRQYSGNAYHIVKNIGLVNCIYLDPTTNSFRLIDYCILNSDEDSRTKIDYMLDMLNQLALRQISYQTILMDSWYAVTDLFKWLINRKKTFCRPIKSNRKVNDLAGQHTYQPISFLSWSAQRVQQDGLVKVYKTPHSTYLRLLRILMFTSRADYNITNDVIHQETSTAEVKSGIRWTVEQFHRKDKQMTCLKCSQCRLYHGQCDYVALATLTWTRFKQIAYQTRKAVYQLKQKLLDTYPRQKLAKSSLAFA